MFEVVIEVVIVVIVCNGSGGGPRVFESFIN